MTSRSLQLFPLQTVLYPHCYLPLHIFEPRYRTMIDMCLEHNVPFGVIQISSGLEIGHHRAQVYQVGTVAEIRKATRYEDGRLMITTQGAERFRILSYAYDDECMTATVETYTDETEEDHGLDLVAADMRQTFFRYWELLEKVMNKPLGRFDLPDEPDILSWLIPSAMQHLSPELKQAILQKTTPRQRLVLERELLLEEIEKLTDMLYEAGNS